MPIPIIDLFTGTEGLGEGFSSYKIVNTSPFKIALFIKKDPVAHQTANLHLFSHNFKKMIPELDVLNAGDVEVKYITRYEYK